jgi:hypothetical protein
MRNLSSIYFDGEENVFGRKRQTGDLCTPVGEVKQEVALLPA